MIYVRIPTFLKSNLSTQKQRSLFQHMFLRKVNVSDELYRRKRSADGHEIIDQPTFNRITKKFKKAGGLIQQDDEAERYLKARGASAIYLAGSNTILLNKEPRVSEVLEEIFHYEQDKVKRFGELDPYSIVRTKREIEAQKYLLSVKDKYKIPKEETLLTLQNLQDYQRDLKQLTGEDDI